MRSINAYKCARYVPQVRARVRVRVRVRVLTLTLTLTLALTLSLSLSLTLTLTLIPRTAATREAARRVDRGRRCARSDVPALWRQRQRRQARREGQRQRGQGRGGGGGEWMRVVAENVVNLKYSLWAQFLNSKQPLGRHVLGLALEGGKASGRFQISHQTWTYFTS